MSSHINDTFHSVARPPLQHSSNASQNIHENMNSSVRLMLSPIPGGHRNLPNKTPSSTTGHLSDDGLVSDSSHASGWVEID